MLDYLKIMKKRIFILSITIIVSIFIGIVAGRVIPVSTAEKEKIVIDTVYVESTKTDSLLQNILNEIYKINRKKKLSPVRNQSKCKDTIRVDAIIHLEQSNKSQ